MRDRRLTGWLPVGSSISFNSKESKLNVVDMAAAYLAAAINDPERARIADPRKGNYAVSFPTEKIAEADRLGRSLDLLEVTYQTNFKRNDEGTPMLAFVTVYGASDQRRMFEGIKSRLAPARNKALERLVLARGPISDPLLRRMCRTIRAGKSYSYLARRLNELGIVEGMGGIRWTEKKVRAALAAGK